MSEETYVKIREFSGGAMKDLKTLTVQRCRDLINEAKQGEGLDQPGKVNTSWTKGEALTVIENAIAGLKPESGCRTTYVKNLLTELDMPLGEVGAPWA